VVQEIYNFLALSDKLLCSGMPTAAQMGEIAETGVQLVINLATTDPNEDLPAEPELVRSLGMKYVHIPVAWDAPMDAFLRVMERHQNQKILVHCRANYRATAFIALFRVLRLGWDPDEALQDLRRIWDPEQYPAWRDFIAAHAAPDAAG
jgi:protein tyrosine phosphatase (PTP) superfamily phosphohydrolase (DUF442 family)